MPDDSLSLPSVNDDGFADFSTTIFACGASHMDFSDGSQERLKNAP